MSARGGDREEAARDAAARWEPDEGCGEDHQRLGLGVGGSHESQAKVSKLTEADDIEAYLTTFERLMGAFSVAKERWVFKLAPQLTGKAQQAYAALDLDKTADVTVSYKLYWLHWSTNTHHHPVVDRMM